MNKRIRYIFLSAVAILFCLVCQGNYAGPEVKAGHELAITKVVAPDHLHLPASHDVSRDNKSKVKAPIRIKAWDDYAAINFPPAGLPMPAILYFPVTVIYGGYRLHEVSALSTAYGLRGPPTV